MSSVPCQPIVTTPAIAQSTMSQLVPTPASTSLPIELVQHIVNQTERPSTLAALMRVSNDMYNTAAPRLYTDVNLHGVDIIGLLDLVQDISASPEVNIERESKVSLLSHVKHLTVHDIPPTVTCETLLDQVVNIVHPRPFAPKTVSILPSATWTLIQWNENRRASVGPGTHPFLQYLEAVGVLHICYQLPLMDQNLENSLDPTISVFGFRPDTSYHRHALRRGLAQTTEINVRRRRPPIVIRDFFGLNFHFANVTIHNVTIVSIDRILASANAHAVSLRLFLRPCACRDEGIYEKIEDRFCYNHLYGDWKLRDGEFRLNDEALRSAFDVTLIDLDWDQGMYDPQRDPQMTALLDKSIQRQLEEVSGTEEEIRLKGKKKCRMSNEVEACRCCKRGQLTATEVRLGRSCRDLC